MVPVKEQISNLPDDCPVSGRDSIEAAALVISGQLRVEADANPAF
jgi:hypothetical protein